MALASAQHPDFPVWLIPWGSFSGAGGGQWDSRTSGVWFSPVVVSIITSISISVSHRQKNFAFFKRFAIVVLVQSCSLSFFFYFCYCHRRLDHIIVVVWISIAIITLTVLVRAGISKCPRVDNPHIEGQRDFAGSHHPKVALWEQLGEVAEPCWGDHVSALISWSG